MGQPNLIERANACKARLRRTQLAQISGTVTNLLGLVVNIPNPIVLNVTAVPGAGNLLGNLLCAVTHLLDNTGSGAGLTALLNNINTILAGL